MRNKTLIIGMDIKSYSSFSEKRRIVFRPFGKEKMNLRILIIWECEDALTDLTANIFENGPMPTP